MVPATLAIPAVLITLPTSAFENGKRCRAQARDQPYCDAELFNAANREHAASLAGT